MGVGRRRAPVRPLSRPSLPEPSQPSRPHLGLPSLVSASSSGGGWTARGALTIQRGCQTREKLAARLGRGGQTMSL